MVRVLQVYPQMNNAGTERVIFNLYENIDTSKVQFDFLVECPGELDYKIHDMGGKIFYIKKKSKREYYSELIKFFSNHSEYKVIHTHTHDRMGIVLKAAKKCGIPCRVAHSHNARNDLPKIATFIKGIKSLPIEKSATHFFSCSSNAAKWLFPHKEKECKILYNGIQLEKYLFNLKNREKVRRQLDISDDIFVMIHVGRFAKQKNHEYLVKILKEYLKQDKSDWKMLFVGEGPLEANIKMQVKEKGLEKHVIFLGARTDVNELYAASDMFVFPSLHEGLGIVVIEAQASGLPCIVSEAVPPEADMGIGLLNTLRLQDNNVEKWCEMISSKKQGIEFREIQKTAILDGNYNIKKIAAQIQEFYLENGQCKKK